jgi:hypothetical protein
MIIRHRAPLAVVVVAGALFGAAAAVPSTAQQAGPTPAERVAALKQSLAQSQKQIRQYEWVETTIISLKGEEKARTQKRCYYGADGKLQKTPMGEPAAQPQQPASQGGRGGRMKAKVVENKKDDMKDYMEKASALIHKYVPPNPDDIQRAKDKVKVETPVAGRARLTFADYLLPGDRLVVDVDAAANKLAGLSVASYLDKKEDTVTLDVKMGALADGTGYTAETTLDAKAKNIRVVIQNTGYKPIGK